MNDALPPITRYFGWDAGIFAAVSFLVFSLAMTLFILRVNGYHPLTVICRWVRRFCVKTSKVADALPRYRYCKVVRAFRITEMQNNYHRRGFLILFSGEGKYTEPEASVDLAWCEKHRPAIGGYCLIDDDGHRSYMSSEQFERYCSRI